MVNPKLQQGIQAAQSGQREMARAILAQVIKGGPDNEQAWRWLSRVVESDQERLYCLRRVLRINPLDDDAAREIGKLTCPTPRQPQPEQVEQVHCSQCGQGMQPGMKFCPACGAALGKMEQPATAALPLPPVEAAKQSIPPSNHSDFPRFQTSPSQAQATTQPTLPIPPPPKRPIYTSTSAQEITALVAQLGSDKQSTDQAAGRLGAIGLAAVEPLIGALEGGLFDSSKREKEQRRRWAMIALTKIGSPAVPALMNALGRKNKKVRQAAEAVLADIGEPVIPRAKVRDSSTPDAATLRCQFSVDGQECGEPVYLGIARCIVCDMGVCYEHLQEVYAIQPLPP